VKSDGVSVLSEHGIHQKNGKIVEIAPFHELKSRYPNLDVIGSEREAILPGLVNSHYHQGFSFLQLGQTDHTTDPRHYQGAWDVDPYLEHLYGAMQMIETGTTTVQVIYDPGRGRDPLDELSTSKVIKAYLDSGMRISYAPEIVNQNTMIAGPNGGEKEFSARLPTDLQRKFASFFDKEHLPVEELISRNEDVFSKYSTSNTRLRINVAPGNVHRCSDDLLIELRDLASKHKTTMHIHLQEWYNQLLYGLWAWGKSPLQHLNDLDFLGPNLDCVHSVWVNDHDIETMAYNSVSISTNPTSNFRLQAGITPINRFLDKKITIALGTDEVGLNDDKDMIQEMKLLHKVHRLPGIRIPPLTASQVFKMSTINSAKVVGWDDRIGTLTPGMSCDVILMNLDHVEYPFLDPNVPTLDAILYRGRAIDIETVIVEGDVVMRERQFTKFDKIALYRELGKLAKMPLDPIKSNLNALRNEITPYLGDFYNENSAPRFNSEYIFNGNKIDN
jgi:cytosine/adenosine deaminase-related metal-dependent hydrolase